MLTLARWRKTCLGAYYRMGFVGNIYRWTPLNVSQSSVNRPEIHAGIE